MTWRIVDLSADAPDLMRQAARLLYDSFRGRTASWQTLASAEREVEASLGEGRISRVMVDDDRVIGWVGGISSYEGLSWELHPLVVAPTERRRGLGRALVEDLEARVRARSLR